MIDALAGELTVEVMGEVEKRASSVDAQFFTMADIRGIITTVIGDRLSSMSLAEKLEVIATVPGASQAEPEMRTLRFTFGEYATAVMASTLEDRLRPLRYELAFAHYEGRILPIMQEAGNLASELVEGPARRCMKPEALESYREDLGRISGETAAPSEDFLNSLLCRACDFFSPLDNCLESPEWGLPVGISEETVGRSAAEIGSWFSMVADLQHLNLRRPVDFSQALAAEIATLEPPLAI